MSEGQPPEWFIKMLRQTMPEDAPAEALEQSWRRYREMVIPAGLNEVQLNNAELTFFSGAHACLEVIKGIAAGYDIEVGARAAEQVRQKIIQHLDRIQPGTAALAREMDNNRR